MLFATINKTLNAYLNLDPESKARLEKLSGQAIAIELLPFHFSFYCVFNKNGLELMKETPLVASTTIRGTPLQMMGAAISKENRHRFFADDLKIEGNAELAQLVIHLFDELDIDWEEYIAKWIGDSSAHHLGRMLRDVKKWVKNAENSMTANVSDYLHEEISCYPPKDAVNDFHTDVDELRMAVDRLEMRVMRLKS